MDWWQSISGADQRHRNFRRHYLELGTLFVAVGLDTNLLVRHTSALAARFKAMAQPLVMNKTY